MEKNGQRMNTSRIVHNEYIYHCDERSGGRRFICGSRTTLLKCSAKLIKNGNNFTMRSEHNHPPPMLRKRERVNRALQERAVMNHVPANNIVEEVFRA